MGQKCLNDLFAYCSGKPQEGDKPTELLLGLGNGCTKDISTCKHYTKEPIVIKEAKENGKQK